MDALSHTYEALLAGTYDCLGRMVVNAYFRMGHDAGRFRVWWRKLTGSEDTLDVAHLMASRFGRPVRGWAAENKAPVRDEEVNASTFDLSGLYRYRSKIKALPGLCRAISKTSSPSEGRFLFCGQKTGLRDMDMIDAHRKRVRGPAPDEAIKIKAEECSEARAAASRPGPYEVVRFECIENNFLRQLSRFHRRVKLDRLNPSILD